MAQPLNGESRKEKGAASPRTTPPTEGDTLDEAFANVRDALAAVIELYTDERRPLPAGAALPANGEVVWSDALREVT